MPKYNCAENNIIVQHRRYAQYTEGIETEAKTKQLEQLIIEE